MKAAVYTRYGPPDVIGVADTEKPVPKDDEVLIQVRAASVNPYDWHFLRGEPYGVRLMAGGLNKPKDIRLGADVAGVVEAAGKSVKLLKPGDEVYGVCRGAFAEYVCTREAKLAIKPHGVTFEQAAAVPIAAITALQALRDKGKVQAGQRVLVNGAAGGVGTFGVQIAKSFGAIATGVCSTGNLEMVRSIGADDTIDYTKEDFTKGKERYDVILDCVGNHSFAECRRVLTSKGQYVGAGGKSDNWMIGLLARTIATQALSKLVGQKARMIVADVNTRDLEVLGELMKSRKVTPVIDRKYALREVAEAIRYLETGHARGKVVITPV